MTIRVPLRPLGRAVFLTRIEPLYVGLRVQPARGAKALGWALTVAIAFLLGMLSSSCNQTTYNYCSPTPTITPSPDPLLRQERVAFCDWWVGDEEQGPTLCAAQHERMIRQ